MKRTMLVSLVFTLGVGFGWLAAHQQPLPVNAQQQRWLHRKL